MSDETTLLPCPFCVGESFVRIDTSLRLTQSRYRVGCDKDPSCHGWYGHSRYYATEAEAIAAWNTRTDYHGYEQAAIEAWKSIKAWNTRATHGTLTAEQVREAIEKRFDFDVWVPAERWQAIADELNAGFENDDDYERKMDTLLCRLTNGKWSKSRAYSIEFMDACISEEFEALYSDEQFSAPVHGTLTAEQVRETVEKHWHDLPDEYDMPEATALPEYSYDWQAIADELNAELGNQFTGCGKKVER